MDERIERNNIDKNLFIGLLCISFLLIGSALSICINNFLVYVEFALLLVIICLLIKWRFVIPISLLKKDKMFFLLIVLSLPSFLYNWSFDGISKWFLYFISVFYAYILTLFYSKEELLTYFVKAIICVSIFSLICYFLFVILRIPIDFMPKMTKLTDSSITYHTLGFYSIWTTEFTRNCGPFWEPSIFAAYLSFALIIRCFFIKDEKKHKIEEIILIITIITTFSTGGYLLLLLIIMMKIFNNKKTNIYSYIFVFICILLFFIAQDDIKNLLLDINYNVFSKIYQFNSRGTTQSRVVSFMTNLQIWKNNFLFGVGFSNMDFNYKIWNVIVGTKELNATQTSTSTIMMASLGIFGLGYNIMWLLASFKQKIFNNLQKVIFAIIIFFVLNETPHTYFIITYFLLFSFLKNNKKTSCNNQ